MNTDTLVSTFERVFGEGGDIQTFFAPGRINLIGEHTDYNGGYVFPASISFGTYAVARRREDNAIRFYSMNFEDLGVITSSLDDLSYQKLDNWANYPKGMIDAFNTHDYTVDSGFDVLYFGNIPNGAGLSSSASIELATGVLLETLFNLKIDRVEMVKLGQYVENTYIGVNSGIMDQFAIGMGKDKHAILLDCNTLQYEYAPVELGDYVIMIMNTNKRRELADSKYNERRSECESALADLQTELDIQSLGDLSVDAFDQHRYLISDETKQKRARHAVYENARTKVAFKKLHEKDLVAFGKLLNDSHASLRDDYEVTGLELDTLQEAAVKQPGVLGARMTGAGFGGCAIALVEKAQVDTFKRNVEGIYTDKIGYAPTFYEATIGDGAKAL
ncbi:galactokinase [Halolactibacillus halophilus]|uniref:Galactokinase n=1 Tax=Halolactibacillus halophilus TaxID=306540 RepID=A0A1I5RRT7_9BACI|nr:galactokinase [Halolactibacillus halophilus]GEM02379.1 galactokinase [Halolactibacillus halophilus]SFP60646.1 galactokinase [Halolactibacillus halophilus]